MLNAAKNVFLMPFAAQAKMFVLWRCISMVIRMLLMSLGESVEKKTCDLKCSVHNISHHRPKGLLLCIGGFSKF